MSKINILVERLNKSGEYAWRDAIVDVLDSAEATVRFCHDENIKPTGDIIVGLTKLIIERHDAQLERDTERYNKEFNNQTDSL